MRDVIFDLMALAGVTLVGVGLWKVYPPASLIVVGGLLLAASWSASRVRSARGKGGG